MTAPPAVTPPATNNRGQPWTSAGSRNLSCVGTGLGNGGTPPPGHYERRRDCLGVFSHDKMWREHWCRLVAAALFEGEITRTQHAVALALADHSGRDGHHVVPGHRRLGEMVGCSRSTVRRSLKRLREFGLLEWEHRFVGPGPDRPLPRGTSNMYEFRLPTDRLAKLGLRQPRAPRERPGRTTPRRGHREPPHVYRPNAGVHDAIASAVASEIRVGSAFDEVRDSVLALGWVNTPELELLVQDELERRWAEIHGPDTGFT